MPSPNAEEIRRYLAGLLLPATPETVVAQARQNGAPPDVLGALEALPPGEWHSLDRVVEVWRTASAGARGEPPGSGPR